MLRCLLTVMFFPWSLAFWIGWNAGYDHGRRFEREFTARRRQ